MAIRYTLLGLPQDYSNSVVYQNFFLTGDGNASTGTIPLDQAPMASVFNSNYPVSAVIIESSGVPARSATISANNLTITFAENLYFESSPSVLGNLPIVAEMAPAKGNQNAFRHGHGRRNRTSPEYRIWRNARNRCTNPRNDHWRWYGAVGIEFQLGSFPEFPSLVGLKPQARLCRIDREDDYRPGNVQWK